MMPRCAQTALAVTIAATMCWQPCVLLGQGNPYTDVLLPRIRAAAQSIPGQRPRELRYVSLGEARRPLNLSLAISDTQRVTSVLPVFQIRFADRWIMVDAGLDSTGMVQNLGPMAAVGFPQTRYDSVQRALRDADAVVLTHEHFDHAIGVQRGPYFKQVASKTLVTSAQVESWLHPPAPVFLRMAPDSVSGFRRIDYDLVYAVAPGVVLIKAPGHTQAPSSFTCGSRMTGKFSSLAILFG
jgi:glyoxylase-like metal-dependent hydrolase (beta-lactamase superfamily II)